MQIDFTIVECNRANMLRKRFVETFINTKAEMYHEHIERLHHYSDGKFYKGYLWEFLTDNENYEKECDMKSACEYLCSKKNVYVMWDLFSADRIKDYCKFSTEYKKNTIVEISGAHLADTVDKEWQQDWCRQELWFPEDIYCFDDTMSWYVIFTHEGWDQFMKPELGDDEYIRICFLKKG